MKKLFVISLAIISLIFVQCKKADTPEQVTEKFISAIQQNDFAVAKALADSSALETLNMIESFAGQMGQPITKVDSIVPDVKDIQCEDMEVKDMKKCYYTSEGAKNYVELKKINNEWKVVNFPKEGENDSADEMDLDMDMSEDMDTTNINNVVAN